MASKCTEKLIKLCSSKKCSGCAACFSACPTNSISVCEDKYSEYHPIINRETCTSCGLCQKVCPQINNVNFKDNINCYAAWRNDEDKRKDSSSGGMAALLYEKFLVQDYICYGVKFDAKKGAFFSRLSSIEDINEIKGSKYVQADIGNIFKEILNNLHQNLNVVFIGTPCQVAGIENLVNVLCKGYRDNIILIDFLCHGTVPKKYLLDDISGIEKKKRIKADGISFRSNIKRKNYYYTLYSNGEIVYSKKAELEPYFYGFLHSFLCRNSCVDCQYKAEKRVGDITIGDFIGLKPKDDNEIPLGVNPSVLLINTNRGKKIVKNIENDSTLLSRAASEAFSGGPSFHRKNVDSELRHTFRRLYSENGYEQAIVILRKHMMADYISRSILIFLRKIKRKIN